MKYKGMSYSEYREFERRVHDATTLEELREVLANLLNHIYYHTEDEQEG